MDGIHVVAYSDAEFARLLSKPYSEALEFSVASKNHLRAFRNYFRTIGAQTIIVEKDYVDRDYLEDYAAYYVRSFKPYRRFCTRLHFFKSGFTEAGFEDVLSKGATSATAPLIGSEHYLGFIVVKPLPETVIGRTCLRTYPHEGGRHFPFVRQYRVNLCGIELDISSIAYQEQDSTVAACASSAIWSAFQQTGALFHHGIPSPVEITKAAIKYFPYANRHFPNKGLTPEQMAHAIRNVGLEPFLMEPEDPGFMRSAIFAYVGAKIPMILGFAIYRNDINPASFVGKHAVTITGFHLDPAAPLKIFTGSSIRLASSAIDKIYVHDDQVGPFARMEFTSVNGIDCLSTSFQEFGRIGDQYFAFPEILLAPLNHKMRISHSNVLKLIMALNELISLVDTRLLKGLIGSLDWSLQMAYSNEMKNGFMHNATVDSTIRSTFLVTNLPKYVWKVRITSKWGDMELLFDATDLEQGDLLLCAIPYSSELRDLFKATLTDLVVSSIQSHTLRRNLLVLKAKLS